MCDTVFAFGQRGGFHFECPSKWAHGCLPERVQQKFTADKIGAVHTMTLGAADSYFISYKGKDGNDYIDSDGLPAQLTKWLYEKEGESYKRDFPKIRISLGPYNESYWATDGTASQWLNLPSALAKKIEEYSKPGGGWHHKPTLVIIGAHEDFLIVTEDGGGAWELDHYSSMEACVAFLGKEAGGLKHIHNAVLHPYRMQSFILQSRNGTMMGEVPDHAKANFESIENTIKEDTAAETLRKQREEEQALQRLETAQENLAWAKMWQEVQTSRAQRAAEQAAMLRRVQQINQVNQMNILMGMFNTFVLNSNF